MELNINWTAIFKKYKGQWVALAEDEQTVVASSADAKEAYRNAQKKGVRVPIMLNVPLKTDGHVGVAI